MARNSCSVMMLRLPLRPIVRLSCRMFVELLFVGSRAIANKFAFFQAIGDMRSHGTLLAYKSATVAVIQFLRFAQVVVSAAVFFECLDSSLL